MSDILHVLGDLDDAEKSCCVQTMIRVIMLELQLTEKAVGQRLTPTVSQTTVSCWVNRERLPTDRHFRQLVRLFFGPWHYVCSFSERYDPSLALEAREALFRARASAPLNAQAPLSSHPSIEIDLHIRPGKLVKEAFAHTFSNRLHNPSIFVVLVRDDIPYEEQYRIAWEEVLAHVIQPEPESPDSSSVAVSLQQHFSERNLIIVQGELGETKGGHWLIMTETQKYLIVNSEEFQDEDWFSESRVVKATGECVGGKVIGHPQAVRLDVRSLRPLT